jgi:hypothetical protein
MQKKRPISDIHAEYSNLCAKAGHIQYQIYNNNKDLEIINQQLRDINLEAAKLQAEEDAAKAEAAKAVASA